MRMSGPCSVVLVSHSWGGRTSLKIKHVFDGAPGAGNRKSAEACKRRKLLFFREHNLDEPDYRVVGPVQLKRLSDGISRLHAARRKSGIRKAAESRKREGVKPHFVLCPTCQSKSKKLFSEMGGVQTRRCKRGHQFEVDMFFGFETSKRRVENTGRPLFTSVPYSDYVYGRYKDDPEGKRDR